MHSTPLGALPNGNGVQFHVWAPLAQNVELVLTADDRVVPMEEAGDGHFETFVSELSAGATYQYRLDGDQDFPDPASRFQPEGVHGPSMVVDPQDYHWQDGKWQGLDQKDLVFYELHVGTFTPEGTFAAARERLGYLKDLGITAVELMPVADFPGRWGWGYDHAALFAPSRAYGTPDELRAFVDAAHAEGMAVFLDVIYNHLGPDGAYVAAYAPMFTDRHHTPWGQAINLDDTNSEGVRRFFIENALHWLREYHADGLRLDATHALIDDSDPHFLADLSDAVRALKEGPPRRLIAEDHRNLNTLIYPRQEGGYGLDGVWVDDFHHQIRNMTAGDTAGYYADFAGTTTEDLAKTLRQGWFYTGQLSRALEEPRGTDPSGIRQDQCVVCIQNHDQVGNRPAGNRLTNDAPLPSYRAASALLLFIPHLPLLFMGQEWGASTPFQFFTDHEPELGKQVTQGRKREFEDFPGFSGDVPDPQDPQTFQRSKLDWSEHAAPPHGSVLQLYKDLLHLRRELTGTESLRAIPHGTHGLVVKRGSYHLLLSLKDAMTLPFPEDGEVVLHTEQPDYTADGQPPHREEGHIRFERAGALIAQVS